MGGSLAKSRFDAAFVVRMVGIVLFAYFFFGFMLLPCLNTLTSIFTTTNAEGVRDPFAVIRFFFAGSMGRYVWNSLKLAICLVVTVNVVGVSIVLLTEYFDIKGANILRLGYMTTMIYSGVALVTGYLFLYASDGILTTALVNAFPSFDPNWFSGFNAVLFTMTFACTSNHALFLRNAIRGIDYNTVEAARNMGAKPFKVLWKVVFPTLVPTMFSLTVMTFITGLCAMSAPTLLGYDSINPEIVRLAGSSTADEAFPQARAALLSIILAMFTIVLLTVLSAYERKGHYLSVSKTKARLQKQKITNPVWNTLAHIYAYVLFIIYMIPVVMIVIFSFQTYGAIRIEVAKSAELDTQQRELTLCLTDSPDLRVGPDLYLKANVSWHNMLPRPATTKQWSTYNAFIESEASSGSSSTEAYSQAGHQLLLDIFGWEVFPDWGPDYSDYIDAWRARAQAWYDEWKAANPGQKRIHESGSMKGREVTIRTK